MNRTIVLYHGACRDGFCAAWVVNKFLKQEVLEDTQFIPAFYGQDPPDVKDKDVIIVDFCYPLDVMISILDNCKSLTWLDHHKTAQPVADYFDSNKTNVHYIFDNTRSGAGIAWDYYFNETRPWIVDYVEDRDLWAKKLSESDKVNAYIGCLEFDFDVWDDTSSYDLEDVVEYGKIAEMKTKQYIREVCKNAYFVDDLNGYIGIPVVNIPQVDCSEVMARLLELYPNSTFVLYWFKRTDGMYQYGMRSIGDFDVSAAAKIFGGGGHKNAAGFQLPYLLDELK